MLLTNAYKAYNSRRSRQGWALPLLLQDEVKKYAQTKEMEKRLRLAWKQQVWPA